METRALSCCSGIMDKIYKGWFNCIRNVRQHQLKG